MSRRKPEYLFVARHRVFVGQQLQKENYPDLPYIPAAAVCTRVISHPTPGVFTFDLGCKGIASDPPGVRGKVVGL